MSTLFSKRIYPLIALAVLLMAVVTATWPAHDGAFASLMSPPAGIPGQQLPTNTEQLPAGTSIQTVLSNMDNPIALAFDPAGRLFYTEKNTGNVRLFQNGALQTNSVITFQVSSGGEQGLLGIAIDPNFNANHFIYVYYTC